MPHFHNQFVDQHVHSAMGGLREHSDGLMREGQQLGGFALHSMQTHLHRAGVPTLMFHPVMEADFQRIDQAIRKHELISTADEAYWRGMCAGLSKRGLLPPWYEHTVPQPRIRNAHRRP